MLHRMWLGVVALAGALLATPAQAQTPSESKYPDLEGQWHRIGPNRWEVGGQKAPLTNDVAMDHRGLIYFTDKACGLDVIEFHG